MVTLTVDSRTFEFPDGWIVVKYDGTPYYKERSFPYVGRCLDGWLREKFPKPAS